MFGLMLYWKSRCNRIGLLEYDDKSQLTAISLNTSRENLMKSDRTKDEISRDSAARNIEVLD
jgi:hypothetical protein